MLIPVFFVVNGSSPTFLGALLVYEPRFSDNTEAVAASKLLFLPRL